MDDHTVTEATPATESRLRLQFTGSGGEYFRIWIINLLLTIATLGVYSAWASVRNRRYIYAHTTLDGQHFDFHADPIQVLKGRAIAIVAFVIYFGAGYIDPLFSAGVLAIGILLFPMIWVAAQRFRLRNTSYRGIRFNFAGTIRGAYGVYLPLVIWGVLQFVLAWWLVAQVGAEFPGLDIFDPSTYPDEQTNVAMPQGLIGVFVASAIASVLGLMLALVWSRARRIRYFGSHARYGDTVFHCDLPSGIVFRYAFLALLIGVPTLFLGVFAYAAPVGFFIKQDLQWVIVGVAIGYVLGFAMMSLPFWYWSARVFAASMGATVLDDSQRLGSDIRARKLWWIHASNSVIVVATLLLGWPWTYVRQYRYKVESCWIEGGDLDRFVSSRREQHGALGDQIGETFDLDLGIGI